MTNPGGDTASALRRRADHALWVDGRLAQSREGFRAAYRAAEATGQPEEMARAALGLGRIWVHEHRSAADAAEVRMLQSRALQRVGRATGLGVRLSVRLAAETDYLSGGHTAVFRALRAAAAENDPLAYAEAISLAHHCLLGPDHSDRRLELAEELLATAARTGRRFDVLMGLYWRTADLFLSGDLRAERSLAELRAALAATGHAALCFTTSAFEVTRAIRSGCFDEAEVRTGVSAALGIAAGDEDVGGWQAAQIAAIRWYQGRLAELEPMLSALVESPTLSEIDVGCPAALAVASAAAGKHRQATCALSSLGPRRLPRLVRSSSWLVSLAGVIEAADALHDRETSAVAYRLLLPFADLPITASLAASCFGSAHHALGVACMTLGQSDRAVMHLRAAVRANQALGHWPAAVMSSRRLAGVLLARGRAEDAGEAADRQAMVTVEAARLGMRTPRWPTPEVQIGGHAPLRLLRDGRRWRIQHGPLAAEVDDCVGMRYLGRLAERPGIDITATDLVAGANAPTVVPACVDRTPERPMRADSRQPLLDRTAAAAYRARLMRLDTDIADAEQTNDLAALTRLRAEREWLVEELRRGAGLGGRPRAFVDDAERARTAVAKAIRRAIEQVRRAEPSLGDRLRAQVSTGTVCRFTPA